MKYKFLDGLRGWAAIVVVVDHFFFGLLPVATIGGAPIHTRLEAWIHNTPLYTFVNGDLSVCIFFVLSAIVLSAKFFRSGDTGVVIASASKRYFRLAIPVIGTVAMAYILLKLHLFRNVPAASLSGSSWLNDFWAFPANIRDAAYQAFYGVFITGANSYNRVLWTMQYEFLGSFLVFMTLGLFGQIRRRYIVYAVLGLIFLKTYYLSFVAGLVISEQLNSRDGSELFDTIGRWGWIPLLPLAFVIGAFPSGTVGATMYAPIATYVLRHGLNIDQLRTLFHVIAAAMIVTCVVSAKPIQAALSNRLSQFLGKISFSVYLLHFLIFGSYSSYLFIMLSKNHGYLVSFALSLTISLPLIISAAWIYTKYVDQFAIRYAEIIYIRYIKKTPLISSRSIVE